MRVPLGKPSVAKQAGARGRESCALPQLAGCKVDAPSYHLCHWYGQSSDNQLF